MKSYGEIVKKWALENLSILIAIIIFVALRTSWSEVLSNKLSVDVQLAFSLIAITLCHQTKNRIDKIIISISYLVSLLSPVFGAMGALLIIIFAKFLLESTSSLVILGVLLICCLTQMMTGALGLELAYIATPKVMMYVVSALLTIALGSVRKDKSPFLTLIVLFNGTALPLRSYGSEALWVVLPLAILSIFRIGLLRSLVAVLFVLSLISGNIYLLMIALFISSLEGFEFDSKPELLPVIAIVAISPYYPQIALIYFSILSLKTLSRSRVQVWLTKHHS